MEEPTWKKRMGKAEVIFDRKDNELLNLIKRFPGISSKEITDKLRWGHNKLLVHRCRLLLLKLIYIERDESNYKKKKHFLNPENIEFVSVLQRLIPSYTIKTEQNNQGENIK